MLHSHPSVKQAAVFGTPHPVMGEVVQAVVTLKVEMKDVNEAAAAATTVESSAAPSLTTSISVQGIIQHCRRKLSGYKVRFRLFAEGGGGLLGDEFRVEGWLGVFFSVFFNYAKRKRVSACFRM